MIRAGIHHPAMRTDRPMLRRACVWRCGTAARVQQREALLAAGRPERCCWVLAPCLWWMCCASPRCGSFLVEMGCRAAHAVAVDNARYEWQLPTTRDTAANCYAPTVRHARRACGAGCPWRQEAAAAVWWAPSRWQLASPPSAA